MKRRLFWLGTGVAIGAGSAVWTRKRLESIRSQQSLDVLVRPARIVGDAIGDRFRQAVAAGREEAQRREDELRTSLRLPVH